MKKVKGNTVAELQTKTVTTNVIGEGVETWTYQQSLTGWLDYTGGNANYQNYNAKLQETTHIFICDYAQINVEEIKCRLKIGTKYYDVLMIDDPMGLNYHIEIYLKYVGE